MSLTTHPPATPNGHDCQGGPNKAVDEDDEKIDFNSKIFQALPVKAQVRRLLQIIHKPQCTEDEALVHTYQLRRLCVLSMKEFFSSVQSEELKTFLDLIFKCVDRWVKKAFLLGELGCSVAMVARYVASQRESQWKDCRELIAAKMWEFVRNEKLAYHIVGWHVFAKAVGLLDLKTGIFVIIRALGRDIRSRKKNVAFAAATCTLSIIKMWDCRCKQKNMRGVCDCVDPMHSLLPHFFLTLRESVSRGQLELLAALTDSIEWPSERSFLDTRAERLFDEYLGIAKQKSNSSEVRLAALKFVKSLNERVFNNWKSTCKNPEIGRRTAHLLTDALVAMIAEEVLTFQNGRFDLEGQSPPVAPHAQEGNGPFRALMSLCEGVHGQMTYLEKLLKGELGHDWAKEENWPVLAAIFLAAAATDNPGRLMRDTPVSKSAILRRVIRSMKGDFGTTEVQFTCCCIVEEHLRLGYLKPGDANYKIVVAEVLRLVQDDAKPNAIRAMAYRAYAIHAEKVASAMKAKKSFSHTSSEDVLLPGATMVQRVMSELEKARETSHIFVLQWALNAASKSISASSVDLSEDFIATLKMLSNEADSVDLPGGSVHRLNIQRDLDQLAMHALSCTIACISKDERLLFANISWVARSLRKLQPSRYATERDLALAEESLLHWDSLIALCKENAVPLQPVLQHAMASITRVARMKVKTETIIGGNCQLNAVNMLRFNPDMPAPAQSAFLRTYGVGDYVVQIGEKGANLKIKAIEQLASYLKNFTDEDSSVHLVEITRLMLHLSKFEVPDAVLRLSRFRYCKMTSLLRIPSIPMSAARSFSDLLCRAKKTANKALWCRTWNRIQVGIFGLLLGRTIKNEGLFQVLLRVLGECLKARLVPRECLPAFLPHVTTLMDRIFTWFHSKKDTVVNGSDGVQFPFGQFLETRNYDGYVLADGIMEVVRGTFKSCGLESTMFLFDALSGHCRELMESIYPPNVLMALVVLNFWLKKWPAHASARIEWLSNRLLPLLTNSRYLVDRHGDGGHLRHVHLVSIQEYAVKCVRSLILSHECVTFPQQLEDILANLVKFLKDCADRGFRFEEYDPDIGDVWCSQLAVLILKRSGNSVPEGVAAEAISVLMAHLRDGRNVDFEKSYDFIVKLYREKHPVVMANLEDLKQIASVAITKPKWERVSASQETLWCLREIALLRIPPA